MADLVVLISPTIRGEIKEIKEIEGIEGIEEIEIRPSDTDVLLRYVVPQSLRISLFWSCKFLCQDFFLASWSGRS